MPDAREMGREVNQKPIDLGHELRGPPPDRAVVRSCSQDFPQAPPHLPEGGPVEVQPKRRSDDRLWYPHSRELSVVEELMTAILASVELLPLASPVPDYPARSAPSTCTPPGDSFMGQLSSWNGLGGTVGFDGQTIDLPGPTVLPTRSAPPFPLATRGLALSGRGSRN